MQLRRWRRRTPDQFAGVVASREPELEVHPGLTAARLLLGEVAQTHQALATFDAPRAHAQREIQQPAQQDREEELREAVGGNAERGTAGGGTEPDEHAD